ncbi:MAG: hypothetical protein IIA67_02190, partial [Planctomycetes bacterium]|nr:hypothetical protein [Planctomycetota bacterium]
LFHDSGPRDSTNIVEQIRQTVAAAKFVRRESQIPVTVSCVVASARSDDSVDTLMSRVDATLKESSRYGENRTFLHADEHPSPVVPPQLEIQELTVRL